MTRQDSQWNGRDEQAWTTELRDRPMKREQHEPFDDDEQHGNAVVCSVRDAVVEREANGCKKPKVVEVESEKVAVCALVSALSA